LLELLLALLEVDEDGVQPWAIATAAVAIELVAKKARRVKRLMEAGNVGLMKIRFGAIVSLGREIGCFRDPIPGPAPRALSAWDGGSIEDC